MAKRIVFFPPVKETALMLDRKASRGMTAAGLPAGREAVSHVPSTPLVVSFEPWRVSTRAPPLETPTNIAVTSRRSGNQYQSASPPAPNPLPGTWDTAATKSPLLSSMRVDPKRQ